MFVSFNIVGRWYFLIAFLFQICLLLLAAFPIPSLKEVTSMISPEFWHVLSWFLLWNGHAAQVLHEAFLSLMWSNSCSFPWQIMKEGYFL